MSSCVRCGTMTAQRVGSAAQAYVLVYLLKLPPTS
jgi:hypothetical protein